MRFTSCKDLPKVSIVIPTYKRADRLFAAIDSVLNQTYSEIEIIIINDNIPGSEWDFDTKKTLQGFNDHRLVVLHTQGQIGGGAARNTACQNATGDYLAFLDDDDIYLPNKIEAQISYMLNNDLDFCWQDVSWYDQNDRLVEHRRLDHCNNFTKAGLLRAHLLTPIAPTSIYMLKRSLFFKTDGFGEGKTGQDWWLMLRCIETDAKIGYMPGVYVHQYLHDGERLSLGQNKIEGENERFEASRKYFDVLSKEDITYVSFRHYAVLAFACWRSHRKIDAVKYAFKAVITSPRFCFLKGLDYFTKGKQA